MAFDPKSNEERGLGVPGMIVDPMFLPSKIAPKQRFRVEKFTIGADEDDSLQYEALLNRQFSEEVEIKEIHKFTFNNNFHVVVTYLENVPTAGKKA